MGGSVRGGVGSLEGGVPATAGDTCETRVAVEVAPAGVPPAGVVGLGVPAAAVPVEVAVATAAVLAFVFAWNEYMLALTFMNSENARTVTVAVATLSGAFVYQIPWGRIAAGVIASSLPLIVLAIFFQKKIVAGLTTGSIR